MEPRVCSVSEVPAEDFPWGAITWLVSGEIGNSESMTVGRVVICKGQANGEHAHSNCDEVLHLLQGELEHTAGTDQVFHLKPGDTITLPAGTRHRARSVGSQDAVMLVAYSSAYREVSQE